MCPVEGTGGLDRPGKLTLKTNVVTVINLCLRMMSCSHRTETFRGHQFTNRERHFWLNLNLKDDVVVKEVRAISDKRGEEKTDITQHWQDIYDL